MVGHQANIIDLTGVAPDSGGAVIVRADRNDNIKLIKLLVGAIKKITTLNYLQNRGAKRSGEEERRTECVPTRRPADPADKERLCRGNNYRK